MEATRSENILQEKNGIIVEENKSSAQVHLAIALKLPVKKAEFPQASITLEEGENYYMTSRPLKLKKTMSLTLLVLVTRLH